MELKDNSHLENSIYVMIEGNHLFMSGMRIS